MSETLKPCPFCGAEAELCSPDHEIEVHCTKCAAKVENAPEFWNMRATTPLPKDDELVSRLLARYGSGHPRRFGELVNLDGPAAVAEIERRTAERDEAQSAVAAWTQVVDSLEAHIIDRAAMDDPANPETYLRILRAEVSHVKERSKQIVASRWHDAKCARDRIERLSALQVQAKEVLKIAADEIEQLERTWLLDDVNGVSANPVLLATRQVYKALESEP